MIVMKFGGTSVASLANIKRIESIMKESDRPYLVVVSALSGTTNLLESIGTKSLYGKHREDLNRLEKKHIDLINALFDHIDPIAVIHQIQEKFQKLNEICNGIFILQEFSDRIKARVMSYGEQMSSFILQKYFESQDISIEWIDSRSLISAEGNFLNADVNYKKSFKQINDRINIKKNYIAGGFIASNKKDDTLLLGRGGSDYSAAIYAAALKADRLELWSDVSGMQNANPRIVKDANTINEMSYKEAFEMAYFGAKVLYPPAIRPVMKAKIPVHLKNTFSPHDKGTLISDDPAENTGKLLGVSSLSDISIINITGMGMAGIPGTARRIFQALEQANINVILITQGCSEQSICLGI